VWRNGSRFVGPEDLIRRARNHKENGYMAFKFRPGSGFGKLEINIKNLILYLREIREAVGSGFDLIQEANTRWSVERCLESAPELGL
jgi:L-alanine-DL-glutamate epimerase-like enolase superfamily enzyme